MCADINTTTALDLDDEPYESAEDEDFQLDAAQDESELSSDDEDSNEPAKKKRRTEKSQDVVDAELDSGDEITIQKAREGGGQPGKTRVNDQEYEVGEDEETGTWGFVRTRAMKKHIQEEERKPLARIDGATVDVDALWAQMNTLDNQAGVSQPSEDQKEETAPAAIPSGRHTRAPSKEQMVKIRRTYKFAGEMITEEKVVRKDSAEAKAFLSGENAEFTEVLDGDRAKGMRDLRRPLRKFSRFDPNPPDTIKKSWERQAITDATADATGPKINTVEKSRLDWAQYVDKAGIKDELRTHSKAKEGYIGRMDFLGRVETKRDEEARQARLRGSLKRPGIFKRAICLSLQDMPTIA
ncbi:SWR1-complex protein 5 [Penicillium diatomitis]|uniref:SWR1-complex protein 5 n=1 Tax=Penicillium diatomitis TaxID=2819901 RepID=A0A9W9XFS0_9EURO|nr:SWR1-complex protein 5 [Penicillium diatomitis]KAJ5490777.1 SWR1-complex protein 5 [Penicillium diatomitis]